MNSIILQAAAGQGGSWSGLLMIAAMILIFWLFMIRPQQKKQKEIKKQREAMKNGDKVVTSGGIHGRVKEIQETVILIEVANGVTIKVDKAAVYPLMEEEKK